MSLIWGHGEGIGPGQIEGITQMSTFEDTDAGMAFIASADSRETSPEVMRAMAFFARDLAEAEALWNGDGFGRICHVSHLWEAATGNGRIDADTLFWGGKRFDLAIADLVEG
jgi:hypothetical protein